MRIPRLGSAQVLIGIPLECRKNLPELLAVTGSEDVVRRAMGSNASTLTLEWAPLNVSPMLCFPRQSPVRSLRTMSGEAGRCGGLQPESKPLLFALLVLVRCTCLTSCR
jgi:hypothetical protein